MQEFFVLVNSMASLYLNTTLVFHLEINFIAYGDGFIIITWRRIYF